MAEKVAYVNTIFIKFLNISLLFLVNISTIYPHTESTTANPFGSIGDAVYSATASNRMLYFGGNWDDTTNAGMFFFFDLYGTSSFSAATLGSRLMYIPH